MYVSNIDYSKAFHKERHKELLEFVDIFEKNIIHNRHADQKISSVNIQK